MKTLLLLPAVVALMCGTSSSVPVTPYHPFCSTVWLFTTPCSEVSSKLVQQIVAFKPAVGCSECGYMLVSATPSFISANHSSVDKLQAENITFTLSTTMLTAGCRVLAKSTSEDFSSLLDGGRNYCVLNNLLTASKLDQDPSFMEMTNEWSCLGYALSSCGPQPSTVSQGYL
ncbi:uncharacterized protein ACB058_008741 [Synchiropus picturatus]